MIGLSGLYGHCWLQLASFGPRSLHHRGQRGRSPSTQLYSQALRTRHFARSTSPEALRTKHVAGSTSHGARRTEHVARSTQLEVLGTGSLETSPRTSYEV